MSKSSWRGEAAVIAVLILLVFALDWITKRWIETNFHFWDTYPVIPEFFSIVHAQNRGGAFSLLADAPDAVRFVVLIGLSGLVTIGLLYMLVTSFRKGREARPLRMALALILAGAAGNLYDRILRGSVTDFLLFYVSDYQWPAFNVADSAIFVGAVILIWDAWRRKETPDAA